MKTIFNKNGLIVFNKEEINYRNYCTSVISSSLIDALRGKNRAWVDHQIESTCLLPDEYVSDEYSDDDYFKIGELSLRPETTSGSYEYAKHLLETGSNLPLIVWQRGKSFRNETDNVTKNVRLKEFYQLEFQCLYSESTKDDLYGLMKDEMLLVVDKLVKQDVRLIQSDRIPAYSFDTWDIEINTGEKWLEICSISLRQDFDGANVVEVAFGLDRLVYCQYAK